MFEKEIYEQVSSVKNNRFLKMSVFLFVPTINTILGKQSYATVSIHILVLNILENITHNAFPRKICLSSNYLFHNCIFFHSNTAILRVLLSRMLHNRNMCLIYFSSFSLRITCVIFILIFTLKKGKKIGDA